MTPIQQLMLGVGAKKKTYIDDVFSTYLHAGNETAKSIVNGVDLTKGGLVWTKNRSHTGHNYFFDTERGATKYIKSNQTNAEGYDNNTLTSFNNNGFSLGVDTSQNENGRTFSTWSFRKAKGFFDVVTYTGNGSARTIAHSLGSVPGMIIIKRLDTADNWNVYHRSQHSTSNSAGYYLQLNTNDSIGGASNRWNDTAPTATEFTVGTAPVVNANGDNFVAYLFAGGESTAATARSVEFDGNADKLSFAADDDFHLSGDFTIEGWFYPIDNGNEHYWAIGEYGQPGGILFYNYSNKLYVQESGSDRLLMDPAPSTRQWAHIALVRSGSTMNCYVNGNSVKEWTYSNSYGSGSQKEFYIGGSHGGDAEVNISNFRVVKGTAVYTSSFKPPTAPLTNITNTVLLCCNNSSVTGGTVLPNTPTANGNPEASTDSPFDDPAGFIYGENEDQGIIKCGSYKGSSSSSVAVELGFEPQWVLIKNVTDTSGTNWYLGDALRGTVTGGQDARIYPNTNDAEATNEDHIDFTPTGFKAKNNDGSTNDDHTHVYVAIRRPDGYVGKPADAGTNVFAMDTGGSSSTIPNYDSGFPVDFAIYKTVASSGHAFWVNSRLTQGKELQTNSSSGESDWANGTFDSNTGWSKDGTAATVQSWMWKRHAGFDVVTYDGNGTAGRVVPHNLSKIPEMIWVKERGGNESWRVYHKGLNGGTNPHEYNLMINDTAAEGAATWVWNDTAPTATVFSVASDASTNGSGDKYIALLFASTDVSAVGYYSGQATELTITTGFAPRFLIVRRINGADNWWVFDTTRGWASGNNSKLLQLESSAAQSTQDLGAPTSTGFTLVGDTTKTNAAGNDYIYYAHA